MQSLGPGIESNLRGIGFSTACIGGGEMASKTGAINYYLNLMEYIFSFAPYCLIQRTPVV
jgi:hypothetical protein